MRLGLVGWRGMVGSVLVERMLENKDFDHCEPYLFTTSQAGQSSPFAWAANQVLLDAYDIDELYNMDALIVTQGSEYTQAIYDKLYAKGWQGYWIDAASHLRMAENARIALDPINGEQLKVALRSGIKTYVGGNCTVSLMLLAIDGLVKRGLVEWIVPMTYQAASGAGAQKMTELMEQMGCIHQIQANAAPNDGVLEVEKRITQAMQSTDHFPQSEFTVPLAGSLIPWIDTEAATGLSKEEWKADVETNKILRGVQVQSDPELLADSAFKTLNDIRVDGLCVRVGTLRCHSQALTIKLNQSLTEQQVAQALKGANPWVRYVENTPESSKAKLTPASVSGGLDIAVGRLRKLSVDPQMFSLFTVGDQLLWGAAEPLRRVFRLILTDK